ncbi:uncharacterized protein [Euwallacea similis]|uniref:uncharacterized protein isoform X2 n=1 Tax=Euwallacea similis TaxID=1736056 RepID=UPI00344E24D7
MYMDLLAAALVLFLSFVYISNKKEPRKIFGVYSQPGKWYFIKYPVFLTLLVLRRLKYYLVGKSLFSEKEFDRRQPLSNEPKAFDAIFFHGVSQNNIFLTAGAERRHQGVINGLIYLQHPQFGLLETPKLPNTKLIEDSTMSDKSWAAEGFEYYPVEPMKKWKLSYKGKMRAHQSHYEQHGFLEGTLKVDSKEVPLKLDAFRDHSFGKKRDWTIMHRYIYQMFYLENQTRIVLGLVSQPYTASHYEMGYVVHANGKIEAIESCDLRLWQHGESGRPSDEIGFTFEAGQHIYECKVVYEHTVAHFVGNNSEVKMYERFGKCEVNSLKGKVISEWNYSNTNGKFNLDQYNI